MADFLTLTCPSCGGRLQITSDIARFACAHCGNEHMVRRAGGIVSLTPVVQELRSIKSGVDRTATELAIVRLREEISQIVIPHLANATGVIADSDTRNRLFCAALGARFGNKFSFMEEMFGVGGKRARKMISELSDEQILQVIDMFPQSSTGEKALVRNALIDVYHARTRTRALEAKREQLHKYLEMV